MHSWLLFALLAPALYTLTIFIDKYLLNGYSIDYRGMPIFTSIVGLVFGTLVWCVTGFPLISVSDTLIILFTGVINCISLSLYFYAISQEQASFVNIIMQLVPAFVLLLSYIFLHQTISILQFIGILIVFSAALFVSISEENGKISIKLNKPFFAIIIYDFFWAISAILVSYISKEVSFTSLLTYESWGICIGGFILFIFFPVVKKAFLKTVKKVKKKAILVMCGNETIWALAKSTTFFAYTLGPAAVISTLESTQPFFALFYAFILMTIAPKIFQEDLRFRTIRNKVIATVFVLVGVILISL